MILARVEFFTTSGLRGPGWAWWVLIQDGHPWWTSGTEHFATLEACLKDFEINGMESLRKLNEATQTWASGLLREKDGEE